MKSCFAVGVTLCISCVLVTGASVKRTVVAGVNFWPGGCVAVTRSPAGTCVINTDCEGSDISQTEFAFDCVGKGIVRHSFGVGGFEGSEEFDTDVKCNHCRAASPSKARPQPVNLHEEVPVQEKEAKETKGTKDATEDKTEETADAEEAKEAEKEEAAKVIKKTEKEEAEKKIPVKKESKAPGDGTKPKEKTADAGFSFPWSSKPDEPVKGVKYGPKGCVSVSRNTQGHCVMETRCKGVDMDNYEYGVVCVDQVGSPVKHLFGKDSFDPEENFDTLIKCKKCLGLEDIPDAVTLAGEVATMAKDIHSINDVMKNISINVNMLNERVFPQAAAPAPAAASPAAAAAEEEAEAPAKPVALHAESLRSFGHGHHKKKHHLRHHGHHKKKHHHRHYDDDDEDTVNSIVKDGVTYYAD